MLPQSSDRHDHELLKIDIVVRVLSAVQDIQLRHRNDILILICKIAIQWNTALVGNCFRSCDRNTENGIRTQPLFVRRPIELDHLFVEPNLVGGIESDDRWLDNVQHI